MAVPIRMATVKWAALVAAQASLYLLAGTSPAEACTCFAQSFAQIAATRPLALVARVETLGPMAKGFYGGESPAFADVEVLWVGKGTSNAQRIRIWDTSAWSNCAPSLHLTFVGANVVFALRPPPTAGWGLRGEMNPTSRKYEWVRTWISPPVLAEALKVVPEGLAESDYDVGHGCGEPLIVLKTEEDVAQYVGKKIP